MLPAFRRNRTFHAVIVALLALGIGSVTLVFSLVNELLLKPLPVRNPRNLYLLEISRSDYFRPISSFRQEQYDEVVRKSPLVTAAVAEQLIAPQNLVPLKQGGTTRLLMAQIVSPNYFDELGVRAFAGRVLGESDAAATGSIPAVLSYQSWQSHFGGDPAIVGRTIRLKDAPFVVVGILPREFHSSDIDRAPDVRLPLAAAPLLFPREQSIGFQLLLRLAPGVTPQRAATALLPELMAVSERLDLAANAKRKNPEPPERVREDSQGWRAALQPIERGVSRVREQFAVALKLLLAGVGLLLLAVCANVAGLLIAKSADRRKELGIRAAIGAARWQLVRQLLGENLLLAIAGAALGGALAWEMAPHIVRLLPPVRDLAAWSSPQLLVVTPDARVWAVAAAATIFCVLASGLLPAWRSTRVDLVGDLKKARDSRRAGFIPVALQVAFCTVLLSAAGLMLRSYWKLDRLDSGFDREHLVEFTVDPASAGYSMPQTGAFYANFRARVQTLPGVRSAAWAWRGVMRGTGIKTTILPTGVPTTAQDRLNASLNEVTPGYFGTMGLPILAGRDVRFSDWKTEPAPTVINQAYADRYFPRQNPIGKTLSQTLNGVTKPTRVVVGVVPTAKYRSMREADPPTIYGLFNETNGTDWQCILYVRTHGAPSAVAAAVRRTLAEVDPGVPLIEAATLDFEIRSSLWQERLVAILSAFFGGASALLASIGLYGALAISVGRRRRELGIRVAVGARLRHVIETVCVPMARGVAAGLAAGLIASVWLLRVTRSLLYGVEPFDPFSWTGAMVVAIACCVAAAAVPVRRASRVDPASALREE